MRKIFKYQLPIDDISEIEMPEGAEILCVQNQYEIACIWALVNSEAENIKRKFALVATGQAIPENLNCKYLDTFQVMDGKLVFHCFELFN